MAKYSPKSVLIRHVLDQLAWASYRDIQKFIHPSYFSWDDIEVVLIVSTGRTGTKFLARLFSGIFPDTESKHEPYPDLFKLATTSIRQKMPTEKTVKNLRKSRERICREVHRKGKKMYIESNNNLAWILPAAIDLFKQCKIIHIIRDPRDYVRSQYSKTVFSRDPDEPETYFMKSNDRRKRIRAVDFETSRYQEAWEKMSRFEKVCWYWCKKNKVICEALEFYDQSITVKFKDLFNTETSYAGLWEILRFLNLEERGLAQKEKIMNLMTQKTNRSKKYLLKTWPNWSREQMDQFQAIIGPCMKQYGY